MREVIISNILAMGSNVTEHTLEKQRKENTFMNIRPSPYCLLSNVFSDFGSVGLSEKEKKIKQKKNWRRSLELGGPVPQRNIRGV